MKKVALVGTHGIGKTTVAYELAGAIKRIGKTVELITEIARECPFPLNDQATPQAFQWIIARQVQLEIEKSARADFVICDRSVLDNFAYYIRRYGRRGEQYEALSGFCSYWMTTYDLLVRLPLSSPPSDDGFRSTDVRFQAEIDALCDTLFEQRYNAETTPAYFRGSFTADEIREMMIREMMNEER